MIPLICPLVKGGVVAQPVVARDLMLISISETPEKRPEVVSLIDQM